MECSGYAQRRSDARKKRYDMMYRGLGNCLESVLKRNLWTQREVFEGSSSSYRWLVIAADEDGVVTSHFLNFKYFYCFESVGVGTFIFRNILAFTSRRSKADRSLRNQSVQRTSEWQFIPLTVMIQCLPAPHTTPSPSPSLSLRVDHCYFCKEMSYDEVCKQVTLTLLKS